MGELWVTSVKFAPLGEYHEAHVVELSDDIIERQLHKEWWEEAWIDQKRAAREIDRQWNWVECGIEYEGKLLECQKVGIMTTDGLVQGGMVISAEAIESKMPEGGKALLVEWLFTAPRNRPPLRNDGEMEKRGERVPVRWYTGVGTELLKWGAAFSRETGYDGRLRLDASPGFVEWYEDRGFVRLEGESIEHEGIMYTPMELPADAADILLKP